MLTDPISRIEELRRVIRQHEYQYYVLTILNKDAEFDALMAELNALESQYI